jgi:putative nucleotidyltransferase with HDIG domain
VGWIRPMQIVTTRRCERSCKERVRLCGRLLLPPIAEGVQMVDLPSLEASSAVLGPIGGDAPDVAADKIYSVQVAAALFSAIKLRDPYTAGHMQRVASLACAIGSELGYSETALSVLRIGACLHDIGKLGSPIDLLTRPGPLDPRERDLMKKHSRAGAAVVGQVPFAREVQEAVLQHHERLDGSGYPDGLHGDGIAPEARIVAVADVFDAMASRRPYRTALGVPAALHEIENGSGHLYDPDAADACLHLFHDMTYRF